MIKEIKNILAFLTIFPVGMTDDCLLDAANHMYLFPAFGALIGLLAGMFAFALTYVFPNLVVGAIACSFLLLLTGLHHMDGLLDFGDGLMCQGSPEKKIEAMHDKQTGTGGFVLGMITVLITVLCIAQLRRPVILQSLIISEALAKLSMVVLAWCGRSAHEGMNTYFVKAMHGNHRKLGVSLAISIITAILTFKMAGLMILFASLVATFVLLWISNRHFGGITGDVMGASNELTRVASLLSILGLVALNHI